MPLQKILNNRGVYFSILGLLIGAVMISLSGIWVKVSQVTPTVSAFYRVFFGGIILLPAALYRREIKWIGSRHILQGLICGLLFALDLSLYHYSIHYVGPGLATILPNLQVLILVAIGFIFLNEKIHFLFLGSMPLALGGLFMIVGVDWANLGQLYKMGVYYGLAAAVCYAGFLLSLRKMQSDQVGVSIFYVLAMVSLTTAFFLAINIYLTGDSFKIPNMQSFLALGALGIFSQSFGWILITNALPHIRASLSGLILLLQPALAFVWDVLFFQRQTSLLNWFGVVIVLVAIYLGALRPSNFKYRNF